MVSVDGWNVTSVSAEVSNITLLTDNAGNPILLDGKKQLSFTIDFTDTAPVVLKVDQGTATSDLRFFIDPKIKNDSGQDFVTFDAQLFSLNSFSANAAHPMFAHFHDHSNPTLIPGWENPNTGYSRISGYNTTQTAPPNDPFLGLYTNASTLGGINSANLINLDGMIQKSGTENDWTNLGIHQFALGTTSGQTFGGAFYIIFVPQDEFSSGIFKANGVFDGSSGNDNYTATSQYTLASGNAGDDILRGSNTGHGFFGDTLVGGAGNDSIYSGIGFSTLYGQGGNDVFFGGSQGDFIYGGSGADTLVTNFALANTAGLDENRFSAIWTADNTYYFNSIEDFVFTDGTVDNTAGSPLVDDLFYYVSNKDVWNAHVSAEAHYNTSGWHEGRDPDSFFSTNLYLAVYKDVKGAGVNPVTHYDQNGWREGRDPGPNFDTNLYLLHNPDVKAAGIDPLAHYLSAGMAEGRQTYAAIGQDVNGFDAEYYLFHNPDVAAAGVDPLQHYNQNGWKEGRNPNAYFDDAGYLAHYTDVRNAGVNPLQHYEQSGWKEGRDPSAHFDTLGYLKAYPDVAAAHVNPLDHYLSSGIYEGRAVVDDGLWR